MSWTCHFIKLFGLIIVIFHSFHDNNPTSWLRHNCARHNSHGICEVVTRFLLLFSLNCDFTRFQLWAHKALVKWTLGVMVAMILQNWLTNELTDYIIKWINYIRLDLFNHISMVLVLLYFYHWCLFVTFHLLQYYRAIFYWFRFIPHNHTRMTLNSQVHLLSGIILCMHSAKDSRCYNVAPSLIGWAHTQNVCCIIYITIIIIGPGNELVSLVWQKTTPLAVTMMANSV